MMSQVECPKHNGSTIIFRQHQITAGLIELSVENPAAVGRDGKRSGTPADLCVLRKLLEKRHLACGEIVKLEGGAGGTTKVKKADSLVRYSPNSPPSPIQHPSFRAARHRHSPNAVRIRLQSQSRTLRKRPGMSASRSIWYPMPASPLKNPGMNIDSVEPIIE